MKDKARAASLMLLITSTGSKSLKSLALKCIGSGLSCCLSQTTQSLKIKEKTMLKKTLLVICITFSTTAIVQPAFAADQTFCGHYARLSMQQFQVAKNNYCGIPTNKNGWYVKFDYPYAWCRETSKEKANQQTKNRYATIGKCLMKRQSFRK